MGETRELANIFWLVFVGMDDEVDGIVVAGVGKVEMQVAVGNLMEVQQCISMQEED
jgi:hypothetical protein